MSKVFACPFSSTLSNRTEKQKPTKKIIKQCINKINSNLTLFQHLINNRKYITKTGYSSRLKEDTSKCKTTIIQEQLKLKSSNKQTCQPERVKNLEIFFSSDKKSGDFTKSSENELI